jgi:hypothetical protein
MNCPECGTATYRSTSGKNICPNCGFGSAYIAARAAEHLRTIDEYKRSLTPENSDKSFAHGLWVLHIYYQAKSTKSEGQYGILFHNDQVVEPQAVGEIIETDLGKLKYYNNLQAMKPTFEHAGWNFADQSKIHPSWDSAIEEFVVTPVERITDGTIKRGWGRAWDVD